MAKNLTQKLIDSHLVGGTAEPGREIALRIDQTLTQDATGTLVMLELEALGLDRVRTELSAQYVDHNLLQQDAKNPDDHLFLESACRRFGIWYSRPGSGVSHPVHMEQFGAPGKTLLGSDSHTCAGGALGMLAIGTGGLEVALAMSGEPFHLATPGVFGVKLEGCLHEWTSAKDVILEMLRRHGVRGARGYVIEYFGPGVEDLDVWDRHVIANMGAELGATTSVFPADETVRQFLFNQRRANDFTLLVPDDGAVYDRYDEIRLGEIEPLIAKPTSPGNVVPVSEVAGEPIYQAYIGSSANPGFRDFAIAALMVRDRTVPSDVSLDINPSTSLLLLELSRTGLLDYLLNAGARIHQPGCNGCIGMGQAPATGRNSLRTVPRNFPGRSGTKEDRVWLCSPETATASALAGVITDPRGIADKAPDLPKRPLLRQAVSGLQPPPPAGSKERPTLLKGPNIKSLPRLEPIPDSTELPVLLKVGDDISTDEILPAGARVLPFRSNVEAIAQFCFEPIDAQYPERARQRGLHAIVGGQNYGQGSSREHAALAPRSLGLVLVAAKSFSRIHRQNLVNFGVLPATFTCAVDYDTIETGATLRIDGLHAALRNGEFVRLRCNGRDIELEARLSPRERDIVLAGGLIEYRKRQLNRDSTAGGAAKHV